MAFDVYEETLVLEALASGFTTSTGWVRSRCPLCLTKIGSSDKRGGLGLYLETGRVHCFRCKSWGYIEVEALGHIVVPERDPEEALEATRPPEDFTPLWEGDGADAWSLKGARELLIRRKVPQHLWKVLGIGACLEGRCKWRVVFPIMDADNKKWAGWVGRSWMKKPDIPYLYPRGFKREDHIYNHSAIFRETEDPVLVTEGVLDAIPYWPDGVAVLGKPAHAHVPLLSQARRPVAVCLDGDAWEQGWAFCQKLKLSGVRAGYVRLPPKTDPNEIDPQWLLKQAQACVA